MSILSDRPDGAGYFYGDLPDGRQLNVSYNPATKFWEVYIQDDKPIGYALTKEDAEAMGLAWSLSHVKEPSQALFQLLGLMTEQAQKFTSTTELMTGEGDAKNAPVGTTQMIIEQGGKVVSTIHRMIHVSLTRELRLRFELHALDGDVEDHDDAPLITQGDILSDDWLLHEDHT